MLVIAFFLGYVLKTYCGSVCVVEGLDCKLKGIPGFANKDDGCECSVDNDCGWASICDSNKCDSVF